MLLCTFTISKYKLSKAVFSCGVLSRLAFKFYIILNNVTVLLIKYCYCGVSGMFLVKPITLLCFYPGRWHF